MASNRDALCVFPTATEKRRSSEQEKTIIIASRNVSYPASGLSENRGTTPSPNSSKIPASHRRSLGMI